MYRELLACLGVLAVASGPCAAAMMTQSQTFSFDLLAQIPESSPASGPTAGSRAEKRENLLFEYFDPAMGALDTVDVALTWNVLGSSAGTYAPEATDGSQFGTTAVFDPLALLTLGPVPGASLDSLQLPLVGGLPMECTVLRPDLSCQSIVSFGSPFGANVPVSVANFLGAGQFGILAVAQAGFGIAELPMPGAFGRTRFFGDLVVDVKYTFTPDGKPGPEVPEPGTIVLMALGLLAVGISRRRG